MKRLTLLLLMSLWPTSLLALEISGPSVVDLKTPAWYSVTGVSGSPSVVWLPLSEDKATLDTDSSRIRDGHAMFWAKSPGQYAVHAIVVDFDARTVKQLTQIVKVGDGGPGPDPDPDPDPGPSPNPLPPLQDLVIGLIEERDQAAETGLQGSQLAQHVIAVQLYLKKLGVRTETLDDDQPAATGYVGHLDAKGISSRPALVASALQDDGSRKYLKVIPFGKDAAATIAALAEAGVK